MTAKSPAPQGIDRFSATVGDLDRSIAFYSAPLGLELEPADG